MRYILNFPAFLSFVFVSFVLLLIVVTQILVSYLVEVFGMFGVDKAGFEWKKLAGAVIAIVGIVVFRWQ